MLKQTSLVKFTSVNLDRAEVVTNSWIIANKINYPHHQLLRLIKKHISGFEEFGRVRFENDPFETKGGKQNIDVSFLNRNHFRFLITLLRARKNAPLVLELKKEMVREFDRLERIVLECQINHRNQNWIEERQHSIDIRKSLTDVLLDSGESERMHGHAYSVYTDLIYRSVLGMSSAKYRTSNGLPKRANLKNFVSKSELTEIEDLETLVKGLLKLKTPYANIKEILSEGLRHAC